MIQTEDLETITLSPEEIQSISRIIAKTIAENDQIILDIASVVVPEEQITHVVNLDAIASSVHGITDILGQISGWFRGILNSVSSWIVSSINSFVAGIRDTILGSLGSLWSNIQSAFGKAISDIAAKVSSAASSITTTLQNIISSAISGISGTISNIVSSATSGIMSAISGVTSAISATVSGMISSIMSSLSSIGSSIMSAISGATSTISNIVSGITSSIMSSLSSIGSSIMSGISSLFGTISSMASSLMSAISSIGSSIMSAFSSIGSSIMSAISNMANIISNIGSSIMNAISSLSNIVSSMASSIMSSLSSIGSSIMSGISSLSNAIMSALSSISSSIMSAISNMANIITGAMATIQNVFSSIGSSIMNALSSIGSSIMSGISSLSNAISSAISGMVNTITNIIGNVSKNILDSLSGIGKQIVDFFANIGKQIMDGITSGIKLVSDAIGNIGKQIIDGIKKVSDFFNEIGKRISDGLAGIGKWFQDVMNFLVSSFQDMASKVGAGFNAISETFMGFVNAILRLPEMLVAGFSKLGEWIWNALPDWLRDALRSIVKFFSEDLVNFFTKTLPSFFDWLNKGFQSFLSDPVKWFTDNLITPLATFFSKLGEWIWNALPDWLKSGLTALVDFFKSLYDGLRAFISDPIGWFDKNVIQPIRNIYHDFSNWLWNNLPDWLKNSLTSIRDTIKSLSDGLKTLLTDPTGWLTKSFANMGEWIWNALPDWLKNGLTAIGDFFKTAFEGLKDLLTDPAGWIREHIIKEYLVELPPPASPPHMPILKVTPKWSLPVLPLLEPFVEPLRWLQEVVFKPLVQQLSNFAKWASDGLKWVWDQLVSFFENVAKAIWEGIKAFGEWMLNAVTAFFQSISQMIYGGIVTIASEVGQAVTKALGGVIGRLLEATQVCAREMGEAIGGIADAILQEISKAFSSSITEKLPQAVKELAKKETTLEEAAESAGYMFSWIGGMASAILGAHYLGFGTSLALHGFASWIDSIEPASRVLLDGEGGCAIEPIGLGARLKALLSWLLSLGWRIRPAWIFRELAKDIRQISDEFTRGLIYGVTIWSTQPLMRLANVAFRDVLALELPDIGTMIEIVRRHMSTNKFTDINNKFRYILKLYGYRTDIINWITTIEDAIEVIDRFGTVRKIPLSLIYELPSPSDVARMVIRDIFGVGKTAIESFLKVYKARGMHEDVGALYYMLHYRYPPPERLWTFTVRGLSKMLWATQPQQVFETVKQELEYLKAPIPTDAKYWNADTPQKARALLSAFNYYMSWHDYFMGTWLRKEIIGAPENFTSDNQIIIDTLADIPTKIDQRWMIKWGIYEHLKKCGVTVDSEVKDFLKIVEPSKAQGALELDLTNFCRTLQATGLHPYWIPVTAVAEAMNVLTEERTLLRSGAQALFKEGFMTPDILEKVLTNAVMVSYNVSYFDLDSASWKTGYVNMPVMFLPAERELIKYRAYMDRALDILREIQRDISNAYQDAIIASKEEYVEKLTHVVEDVNLFMPNNLKLTLAKEYYEPYIKALDIYREVYTVRRIRSWTMRWLGWIMYRVATGLVTDEELNKLVYALVKYSKLTDVEMQFFSDVFKAMKGIAMREYAPSPSQLATLAEYIAIPGDLIEKSFEIKMIAPEWRDIWRQYIKIRPIVDDVKALINTYRRALLYVKIPPEVEKQILALAQEIGYTERELSILGLRVQLEELIMNSREYIPTPSMLASLVEYVPEAREFFKDVMTARRVPEKWQAMWAKYIDIRPLVDDVKRYLTRAETLYARFMIKKADFDKILSEVADYLGYTKKETEFLMKITDFERYRNAWVELIGTVDRLVELSEYSPRASKFALAKVNEMIDALPLPPSDKQELKIMWEEYIRNRPVKSEARTYITQIINAYVEGLITQADFYRELENMKKWGFSDTEIEFYKAQAEVRKARKLKIPLVYGE